MRTGLLSLALGCLSLNGAAQNFALLNTPKGITISNGITNIKVSDAAEDTLAILYKDAVYYIHNQTEADGRIQGKLMCYTIHSKNYATLFDSSIASRADMRAGKIVQLVLDPQNAIIYGTSIQNPAWGASSYLSFSYNIATQELNAHRDGLLSAIDANGLQTTLFYDKDEHGSFMSKNIYYSDGRLFQTYPKVYLTELAH